VCVCEREREREKERERKREREIDGNQRMGSNLQNYYVYASENNKIKFIIHKNVLRSK
jgi:hypothetical protein